MMKKFLIFGILAAILVPSMIGYVKKSKEMSAGREYSYDDYDEYFDLDY